jgi:hypothetical protein
VIRAMYGEDREAKLGNDLSNAAFRQKSMLTEKEMPIWEAGSRRQKLLPGPLPARATGQPDVRDV